MLFPVQLRHHAHHGEDVPARRDAHQGGGLPVCVRGAGRLLPHPAPGGGEHQEARGERQAALRHGTQDGGLYSKQGKRHHQSEFVLELLKC